MYGLRCRMQSCSSKGIFCFLFKPKCRVRTLKMDSFWATDLPNMTTMNRSVPSSLDFLIGKSLSINRKSCQSPGFCPEIFVYIITPICNKKTTFQDERTISKREEMSSMPATPYDLHLLSPKIHGGCHPAPPALTGQTGVFLLLGRETAKGTTVVALGEKRQIPGE